MSNFDWSDWQAPKCSLDRQHGKHLTAEGVTLWKIVEAEVDKAQPQLRERDYRQYECDCVLLWCRKLDAQRKDGSYDKAKYFIA